MSSLADCRRLETPRGATEGDGARSPGGGTGRLSAPPMRRAACRGNTAGRPGYQVLDRHQLLQVYPSKKRHLEVIARLRGASNVSSGTRQHVECAQQVLAGESSRQLGEAVALPSPAISRSATRDGSMESTNRSRTRRDSSRHTLAGRTQSPPRGRQVRTTAGQVLVRDGLYGVEQQVAADESEDGRHVPALYLAPDEPSAAQLKQMAADYGQRGIEAQWLSPADVRQLEPALASEHLRGACLLPDECQLRNLRHVKGLLLACRDQGVTIQPGTPIDDFVLQGDRIIAARAAGLELRAKQFCVAGGAWTRTLLERLGFRPRIKPIRGQIVLLSGQRVLKRVVNEGHRYLVPRADGRVLVGSTEEDVGFDKRTTAEAIGDLLRFALELVPPLKGHHVERTWAGLRPGNGDGLPYLGRIPGLANAFVAAGHYRQGLHLSPGTAVVMSELIRGLAPQVDLTPFRLDRD